MLEVHEAGAALVHAQMAPAVAAVAYHSYMHVVSSCYFLVCKACAEVSEE